MCNFCEKKVFSITVQKCKESKHRKGMPSSSRISKIGPGMSFLDEVEPDSASLSQRSDKSSCGKSHVDSVESIMEVGRKVSPRKRVRSPNRKLVKKCKIYSNGVHETVPQTYLEDFDNLVEERYRKEMDADRVESADSEDLLEEISRIGEKSDDNLNKDDQMRRKEIAKKRNNTQPVTVSSVLDDVFDVDQPSHRSRKPPPSKYIKTGSPRKQIGKMPEEKHEHCSSDEDDPFKIVDEIFSCGSNKRKPNGQPKKDGDIGKLDLDMNKNSGKAEKREDTVEQLDDEDEVNLEDSTLKDDNYDCFDDPKLWKKRKRKERDKGNVVDRLIRVSDSDYNDLFTSGKLKKKESKTSKRNNRRDSEKSEFDGSASLFS